jgi:nicotinate-nucleotide pyrophosphorylase (carboxylating)
MTAEAPDRVTLMAAAMRALLDDDTSPSGDPDAVGSASIVCGRGGVIAGLALAKEIFGRLGVRFRAAVVDGAKVRAGEHVAVVGGPAAAIEAAAPTALGALERLSAIASGSAEPASDDVVDAWALSLRLSSAEPVGDDGPSFRLGS